jgi:hypothetical protein
MFRTVMLAAASIVAFSGVALAQTPAPSGGTAAEAKAMLQRAIPLLQKDPTSAIATFNKGENGFKDRDLYVFCFNTGDGKFTAHQKAALIGTDVRDLKAKSGRTFGLDIYNAVTGEKEGEITEVSYMFPKPGGTEPVAKHSFLTKVGTQGCGVGYYP